MRLAIIKDKVVESVIIGDIKDFPDYIDVTNKAVGPGWRYTSDGKFLKPLDSSEGVKNIDISDILYNLPFNTRKKIEKIAKLDTADGDIADLILTAVVIGKPVDVNGERFNQQAAWMLAQDSLDVTQEHIDKIKAL